MAYKIVFQPMGINTQAEKGQNLLSVAQLANVGITAYCGSKKTCGKCKVKIVEGDFKKYGINSSLDNANAVGKVEKEFLADEEIKSNYRLACNVSVEGDLVIEVPKESRVNDEIIIHDGRDMSIHLNPAVKIYALELEKATLEDHTDDVSRIVNALKESYPEITGDIGIEFAATKDLSEVVRKSKWKINVALLNDNKIIRVTSAEYSDLYGFAIDVGTTTVAVYLCDLAKGEVVQTGSMMNPQISYGDDVLSRISHCQENEGGVEHLRKILLDGLNDLTGDLMNKENIEKEAVVDTVVVFNTVMQHIALGISPKYIGVSPFVSTITRSMDITARDFGLDVLASGNIHCLPAEAGFIGSDNVAVLIGEEPHRHEEMKLIIDIGTNSEICLGNKEQLYVTSCATGPALEGAQISCGMRAAKGAIEKVEIDPATLEPAIQIIGGEDIAPVGICGSGIIDVVSEMAAAGIIEANGKFSRQATSRRIRKDSKGKFEYVLYFKSAESERDIVITQKDVRAVQLAKAALYAGAKMLMKHCDIDKVDEIILAGGFGSYIDREKALNLGLYPDCLLENVRSVGNGAGLGARLALLNKDKRTEAAEVASNVEFLEIATDMEYQKYYAQAMAVPHAKDVFTMNQKAI